MIQMLQNVATALATLVMALSAQVGNLSQSINPASQLAQVAGTQTPAFIQSATCLMGGQTCTITITNTAGNFLWVGMNEYSINGLAFSISDTKGNLWSTASPSANSGDGNSPQQIQTFYAANIQGGSNTITCTRTTMSGSGRCMVAEYSGVDTTAPLDTHKEAVIGNSTNYDSGFINTSNANNLLIGFFAARSSPLTWTAGANYSIVDSNNTDFATMHEYRTVSSAGSYNVSATINSASKGVAAFNAFKSESGGLPPPPPDNPPPPPPPPADPVVPPSGNKTFYIDYATGNDSNNGTSKSTPWKHAPGMNNCANTCASTTPRAGDQFILKGGVTWTNASMGWLWTWSGTSTTFSPGCTGNGCIYIGVDQTWYSGSSWSRPILNAGGTQVAARDGVPNTMLRLYANYVTVDNLEFTGIYWTGVPVYGTNTMLQVAGGSPGIGTNIELKNLYMHGWSHNTMASGTSEHPCAISGDTGIPNNNVNTIIHDSVIDGSDTARNSCTAIFGTPPYIERNYLNYVTSGIIANGTIKVDGNTITNIMPSFDTGAHTNGIEINAHQNLVISNNLIAHLGVGTLGIWTGPNVGYSAYVFNNVMYDTDTGNVLDLGQPVANGGCPAGQTYCLSAGSHYVYNNTIQCGQDSSPNSVCAAGISGAATAVELKNNHWITNATTPNGGMWSTNGVIPIVQTNLVQTASVATGAGYTSGQTNPFSPSVSNSSTVNSGTNLSSLCNGLLSGLCTTTAVGVNYNAVNHTVSYPKNTLTNRSATPAAWDIGAYEYTGSTPPPSFKTGDFNHDGLVNSIDLSLMITAWNQSNATYDLNHDSIVNSLDYVMMVVNWTL